MKAEDQILFLSELLHLIGELQETVREYCREMIAEQEECIQENTTKGEDVPF